MKRLLIGLAVLGIVGAALFAFFGSRKSQTQVAQAASTPAPAPAKVISKIVAEGKVVPVRSAALSFRVGGVAVDVPELGARVAAGAVLAQQDTRQLDLQLAQAEANLVAAQSRLSQLRHAPTAEEKAAAQQNLAAAQAAYDRVLHPDTDELIALKVDVDKTKAILGQAQAAYDRIGGDSNPYAGMTPQRAQVQTAWLDYQKALALYNRRMNPADADVQHALASVASARQQLAQVQPTADELAEAEANVQAAQAARDLAAEQVKNAQVVAPFAGTVTEVDVKPGEYVGPGTCVLRLADLDAWQVETTDLTELSVVSVQVGTKAAVTFDALPGLELPGRVSGVNLYGKSKQGDIVYTVYVQPEQMDERVRWNMTAQVGIEP